MSGKRDGSVISDEMRDDCAAYTAGWMTKAAYEAASAVHHAELDVLFAESRQQQDHAMAEHRTRADRAAGARQERAPRPGAIPHAHMARVIRDLDVPGYTEPEADREAGQ